MTNKVITQEVVQAKMARDETALAIATTALSMAVANCKDAVPSPAEVATWAKNIFATAQVAADFLTPLALDEAAKTRTMIESAQRDAAANKPRIVTNLPNGGIN